MAIIESGQKIEVIKKGNQWTLVRLTDGKEGWVYSRYLADIPTSDIKLEKLNLKHKNLIAQVESFQEKNHKHKLENKTLSAALATSKKSFNNLQGDYEALKADSSKYLILKSKYEKVSSQLSEQTRKTKNLEAQISELQLYYFLKWVLAVGGYFVGWFYNWA